MRAFGLAIGQEATAVRETVAGRLGDWRFRLDWTTPWSANATKGSAVGYALLGWLLQRTRLRVSITSAQPGQTVVIVALQSTGFA